MLRGALMGSIALLHVVCSAEVSYSKYEYQIPMRDGVKLYTAVYVPVLSGKHPILLERTPYGCGPYGAEAIPGFDNSEKLAEAGYIFAFQDVRGHYMSEGNFVDVRPELQKDEPGIDESTDTFDTIDYLVKHVPNNSQSVGLRGISYPGFYAGVGAINTHPALKAVSPQAPVSNWFLGDDFHHNGAFFEQDAFEFYNWFGWPRSRPATELPPTLAPVSSRDGAYAFYLNIGALPNLDTRYFKKRIPFWNDLMKHETYDQWWQDRSLPDHARNITCAVLTVGGLFDAEDMWGALNLFRATSIQNPNTPNYLVMGPWYHGMWADGAGRTFGDLDFKSDTSRWFRDFVEFPFFEKYLAGNPAIEPAKATIFETGKNKWQSFAEWPPLGLKPEAFYLDSGNSISSDTPVMVGSDSYINDPEHPTPYLADLKTERRTREYMVDDQRWAEKRNDVKSYKANPFTSEHRYAGPVDVDFWVSTSGTDADFVVKLIDVWPSDSLEKSPSGLSMAGYEQNLRADIFRGKFRNSFAHPEPFEPSKPTHLHFKMNDILHTFLPGHRLMIQVQSSWFPLVDQNPNVFENINEAKNSDFKKATITIYHDPEHPSKIVLGGLPG